MAHQSSGASQQSRQREEAPPLWEWVAAAVGLLLVLACIGYLTWAAMVHDPGDVVPVVELVSVQPQQGRYLARVRVENRGRAAAAALGIRGVLRRDDELVERSRTHLDYLPGRSAREAALFFERDPRQFQLELAPEGFQVP